MGAILLKNINLNDVPSDIYIEDGLVRKICKAGEEGVVTASGAEIVDCSGKAALPGFINMHTHSAMNLMRGLGEDMMLEDWLAKIWQVEAKIDEEYIYWATRLACLEMIKTGTTTYNDQYWYPAAGRRAAVEMGIRPVVNFVTMDFNDKGKTEQQKEGFLRLYEESGAWGDESVLSATVHSVYTVSEELICWVSDFAKEHNMLFHTHVSESRTEVENCIRAHGMSPVKYLDSLGALGPHTIAAHTVWLSDEDIEILGRNRVNCVHNINSNLKLASGYKFKYNELRDAGANVCIGTDGCASSNNLDVLEALKTAALLQKAWRNDPTAMPLDELMDIAARNGAVALGLNTGRIEEGAEADIMIIDTDNYNFISAGGFLANFIYSAHSDCIDSLICRGRFVMRGRKVEGEAEILGNARRVLKKLL